MWESSVTMSPAYVSTWWVSTDVPCVRMVISVTRPKNTSTSEAIMRRRMKITQCLALCRVLSFRHGGCALRLLLEAWQCVLSPLRLRERTVQHALPAPARVRQYAPDHRGN